MDIYMYTYDVIFVVCSTTLCIYSYICLVYMCVYA